MARVYFGERMFRGLLLLSRLLLAFFLSAGLQAGIGKRFCQLLGAGLRVLQRSVLLGNLLSELRGSFLTGGNLVAERLELGQAGAKLAPAGDQAGGRSSGTDGECAVFVEQFSGEGD